MIREIVRYGDPILRARCIEVGFATDSAYEIMQDLYETLHATPQGIALSANQIGFSKRIFFHKFEDSELPGFVINPKVNPIAKHNQLTALEGCLSIPGFSFSVTRYDEIEISGLDRKFEPFYTRLSGLEARMVQHEVDHLDGVCICEYGNREERRKFKKGWK